MPYNQKFMSASIQGCVFCVQGRAVGCSFFALLLLIEIYKPKCVSLRECMKEGCQVAVPDLLTQLHLHAHECTDRRETEKKGV